MPSQSRLEGDDTFDHSITTTSPDLLMVLGDTVSVGEADADVKDRKISRRRETTHGGDMVR